MYNCKIDEYTIEEVAEKMDRVFPIKVDRKVVEALIAGGYLNAYEVGGGSKRSIRMIKTSEYERFMLYYNGSLIKK